MTYFVAFLRPQRNAATALDNAVLRAQQEQLSQISLLSACVSFVNAVAIYTTYLLTGATLSAHLWFAVACLSVLMLLRRWMRDQGRSLPKKVSGRYMRIAEYSGWALGGFWGLAVYASNPESMVASLFVFVVVVSMATGFNALTASAPRVSLRFAIPCFAVSSSYFIVQGGVVGAMTGTLIFVLLFAMIIGGIQTRNQLVQNVKSVADAEAARKTLDDALEAINDAFAVFDAKGELLMANSRHRQWFPQDFSLDRAYSGKIVRMPDEAWAMTSKLSLEDGRTVCIHKDVTSLKQREAELISARQEAEDANAAKARFMSKMSHELRAPLNIINGFSKIMSSSSKVIVTATEMREYSDSMLDAGEHLLAVINDIIEFSQVGTDRYIHDPAPEDVGELLAKSISLSAKFQGVSDIADLDVSIADNLGELVVDEAAFRRVLISLLSNAFKFGGQPARVVVRAFLGGDGRPVISIRDFGFGIAENEIKRVFEPFYQGEKVRAAQFSGTGLGLPLARELMRLHGGTVEISSREGVGTTASLVLPASAHLPRRKGEGSEAENTLPRRHVREIA
ncbi:MAG: HAMP domain-containing sensor histidine kinase [Pseudomonadota bacterium]